MSKTFKLSFLLFVLETKIEPGFSNVYFCQTYVKRNWITKKYYFDRLTKEKIFSELNLSNNRISTLPEEIAECTQLEKIDISQVVNFRDPGTV